MLCNPAAPMRLPGQADEVALLTAAVNLGLPAVLDVLLEQLKLRKDIQPSDFEKLVNPTNEVPGPFCR